mmetsp:Transcript_20147/g.24854  ORF Transcript_20147/g.24854 Transcript_20147/m.24854 type:complete len:94 (-) Transcript_20147:60-341(-)
MSLNDTLASYAESLNLSHPIVSAEDLNGFGEVLTVLQLLFSLFYIRKNINSHFYYWHTARAAGAFLGNVFTASDRWFDLGIITPQDPWDRFTV